MRGPVTLTPPNTTSPAVPPGAYALGHLKVVNYYRSCAAALVFNNNRAGAKLDRVSASLVHHLHRESDEDLRRGDAVPDAVGSVISPPPS